MFNATEKQFSSKNQASQLESAELSTPCKKIFGYLEKPEQYSNPKSKYEGSKKQIRSQLINPA